MIFHSIRWRLQIWHGLILLLVLTGFGLTAYRLQYANEMRRVDQELQQHLSPLMEAMRRPPPGGPGGPGRPGGQRPRRIEDERGDHPGSPRRPAEGEFAPPLDLWLGPNRAAMFEGDTNAFYYVIWLRDGREWNHSAAASSETPFPEPLQERKLSSTSRMRGSLRELYDFTPPGECILVGRSVEPELDALHQLALGLGSLGGVVLLMGLAGGWWLATRAISPIDDISAAASMISGGDLSHRINTENTDNELGQLASVLNSTFARLEASFIRQQQFTADASHELRTPVAVILSQTQATLAHERNPNEYRETLEACQRAAQRMRALTESLLVLARIDAGQETSKRERIDLSHLALEYADLLSPLAKEHHVEIRTDLRTSECLAQPQQLAQVISNILTNAILYNNRGGRATISTRLEQEWAILSVADTGPGIQAEHLQKVFERFYRADKSRSGATAGAGLGLAISKAIIKSHGGEIKVTTELGVGSVFTVSLPAIRK